MTSLDSASVAKAHDEMADEYDRIIDPWYTHLFSQIHNFVLESAGECKARNPRALDIGCGTGLQAFLLADAGFDVFGIDLSAGLIAKAREKLDRGVTWDRTIPFGRDMVAFHEAAAALRGPRPPGNVHLAIADAANPMAYREGPFDLIVSCGSVLSFVEDPDVVLRLMRSALKPDGRIVIEVEMKANLDLVWPVVDLALGGRLGYEMPWRDALANLVCLSSRDITVLYPFECSTGTLNLAMRLFSHRDLRRRFTRAGLVVRQTRAIHAVTNVFPSTVLHEPVGAIGGSAFRTLARIDTALSGYWPACRLGCSAMFELRGFASNTRQ